MFAIDYHGSWNARQPRHQAGDGRDRRRSGHGAGRYVGHARGRARRGQRPEALRHGHAEGVRFLPPVPRGDRGSQGLPRLVHHHRGAGHEDQDAVREAHCSCVAASSTCYVSDHPLECDTCPADQHCELQDMAAEVGITESSYAKGATHWPETPDDVVHDTSNPYFGFNPELCIVCSRCVRACDEVQGTFALTIQGRGFDSKVAGEPERHRSWTPSACPAAPVSRAARPARSSRSRSSRWARPTRPPPPPARTAASAARSARSRRPPRPARPKSSAWRRTAMATRTTVTRA